MSIASQGVREFNKELVQAINSMVKVLLKIDYPTHYYYGRLVGISEQNQSLVLEKALDDRSNKYDKIFIHGEAWISFTVEGEPFPMEKLVDRLRKILPGEAIELSDDNTISLLGGKLMVTEKGVQGRGPTKARVQTVFDAFVAEMDR